MSLTLRPYQTEIIQQAIAAWKSGYRRVMMQLPTAAGKTTIFSDIARTVVEDGGRVLLMSHRTELVEQGAARLELMTGLECGIIQGGRRARPSLNLQSASVQSLGPRLNSIGPFDLVIIDEAHHGSSKTKTYGKVLQHFRKSAQLGVTATPVRTDRSGFGDMFDVLIKGPSVKQLIANGYLSKYRLFADASVMNTDGVRQQGGDYNQRQLAEANDALELSGSLVGSYLKHCAGKQCLVFAINVEHSLAVADAYQRNGIKALHLDSTTPKDIRAAAIAAFKSKEIQIVTNVGLFTEGTDIPGIDAVQIARPTESLALHLQMLGRALRTAPGKEEALLIDHTDNYARLGLPCRDRLWTLEGVEDIKALTVVNESGEVEEQLVLVSKPAAVEKDVELTHIKEDPLDEWASVLRTLIDEQVELGKPAGWVPYRLTELHAPLEVWEEYAQYAGHRPSWAKLMFRGALGRSLASRLKPLPKPGTTKPETIEQLVLAG